MTPKGSSPGTPISDPVELRAGCRANAVRFQAAAQSYRGIYRHISAKFRPVTIPSLADSTWKRLADLLQI
jgi:hypothetical protein